MTTNLVSLVVEMNLHLLHVPEGLHPFLDLITDVAREDVGLG